MSAFNKGLLVGVATGTICGTIYGFHTALTSEGVDASKFYEDVSARGVYVPEEMKIPEREIIYVTEDPVTNSEKVVSRFTNSNGSYTIKRTKDDAYCLAANIYFEAAVESHEGRKAVASTTLNRVISKKYPNNICDVVTQSKLVAGKGLICQFSWHCDGKKDIPYNGKAWKEAIKMAYDYIEGRGKDNTGGALWYHADYVNPWWNTHYQKTVKIGKHIFYKTKD